MEIRNSHLNNNVNWCQVCIGLVVLGVGTLVYLIDRAPEQTYFVYATNVDISLHHVVPGLFGVLGNNMPAFIHVFAFILITAGLAPWGKKGYLIICLSWCLVDIAFELGQNFNTTAASLVPGWFDGIPLLENSRNYFLRGTFDAWDILFILLGATFAYIAVIATNNNRKDLSHEFSYR